MTNGARHHISTTAGGNKELARRSNEELWGEGNLDVLDGYVADDYVGHNTASPEPIRGPEGYRENVRMVRSAFPNLEVTTGGVIEPPGQ